MRKEWSQFFMETAEFISGQSTCQRRNVGAIAVRDKQILATGFNGVPSGFKHCTKTGCARKGMRPGQHVELCRAVHAEQNVIIQAAKNGTSLKGASMYVNTAPCSVCVKMILNSGIVELFIGVYDYPDKLAKDMIKEAVELGLISVVFLSEGVIANKTL